MDEFGMGFVKTCFLALKETTKELTTGTQIALPALLLRRREKP